MKTANIHLKMNTHNFKLRIYQWNLRLSKGKLRTPASVRYRLHIVLRWVVQL